MSLSLSLHLADTHSAQSLLMQVMQWVANTTAFSNEIVSLAMEAI